MSYFPLAYCDTLYLKNGRSLEGIIKSEDDNSLELEVGFGTVKFFKSQIEDVYRSTPQEEAEIRKGWLRSAQEAKKQQKITESKQEYLPKSVEFVRDDNSIVVDAILEKKHHVTLTLDTGASLVLLTKEVAKRLRLNLDNEAGDIELIMADGSKKKAKFVVLASVNVQGVEAKDVAAAVLLEDIEGVSFKDGLLGMSYLKNFNIRVDQKRKRLILERIS